MADLEKAPLLPSTPTDDTPPSDPTPEDLANLQTQITTTREAYLAATRDYRTAWTRTASGRAATLCNRIVLAIALTISGLLITTTLFAIGYALATDPPDYPRRVPLEAHIMSKCPDARDCLRDMVLPAMMEVQRLVDFRLSYIGTATEDDEGVLCMHGPEECLGNILELCAQEMYSPKISLGFAMCLSREYKEVPREELVRDCALEHGISFERLEGCASERDGGRGLELLRASVDRSRAANVTTSCTVRVDGKEWCVRDGGKWKNCPQGADVKELISEVKRLHRGSEDDAWW